MFCFFFFLIIIIIIFLKFCSEMDAMYAEYASKQESDLYKSISFQDIIDEYSSSAKVIPEMLNAATALRKHG